MGTTQSLQTADVDNKLKNIVGSSLATSAEEFTKVDDDYSTKTILVNPPSQVVETNEDVGSLDALPLDVVVAVSDINGDCNLL